MAEVTPDKVQAKRPNTRKYETGTTIDSNRLFRAYDSGEVFDLEDHAEIEDIRRMLKRDAQAYELSRALRLPIRSAQYDIVARDGDKGERDFVEWALHAPSGTGGMTTPFRQVLSFMSNAIVYKFAPFEKVWKLQDKGPYRGKVVLHKLGYRPPNTCSLKADLNGTFNGFIQRVYKGHDYKEAHFAPDRSFVYIHEALENPIVGSTPFEVVYNVYKKKQKVEFFYYAFLENVAFPKTVARLADDDPEGLQHLINKAKKFGSQGLIGLFEEENIETYESQRNTRDYQTAMEYLDWQMVKACLSEFLNLGTTGGADSRGSYAMSNDKSDFFYKALESMLEDVENAVNNYIINDLIKYNYGIDATYPYIKFRPLHDETIEPVMEIFRNVQMSNAPNATAPFLLKLMERVSQITGLDLDPLEDLDEKAMKEIRETIPTAREEMESKESRAGSGGNPITGMDRNNNNKTPQSQEPAKTNQTPRQTTQRNDDVEQGRK